LERGVTWNKEPNTSEVGPGSGAGYFKLAVNEETGCERQRNGESGEESRGRGGEAPFREIVGEKIQGRDVGGGSSLVEGGLNQGDYIHLYYDGDTFKSQYTCVMSNGGFVGVNILVSNLVSTGSHDSD